MSEDQQPVEDDVVPDEDYDYDPEPADDDDEDDDVEAPDDEGLVE